MLSQAQTDKLMHDIKRMAKVMKLLQKANDSEQREALISLLIDESDRMAKDILEMQESGNG